MKNFFATATLLTVTAFLEGRVSAQEGDPFADTSSPERKGEEKDPETYETTGFYKVTPSLAGFDPEGVDAGNWPEIENPVAFNRHFDRPDKIWRVDGGYFGAFDGGEWGGALFFATDKDTKWTRIIDTHIDELERFDGDSFLAAGGLAHLGLTRGAAHLITRKPTGEWVARLVFHSESGIPSISGISSTDLYGRQDSKKLIVLNPCNIDGPKFLLGVDASGSIYYLGDRKKPEAKEPSVPAPVGDGKEKR